MLLISISFISIITILMKGKRAFIIEKQLLHLAQTNPPVIQCRCKVKWILSLQVYLDSFWAESKLNLCLNGREKIYCNFWMNIFLLFTEGKMIHINLVFKMMSSTFFCNDVLLNTISIMIHGAQRYWRLNHVFVILL